MILRVQDQFNDLFNSFKKLAGMIANLIDYIKGSGMRGQKYKKPTYKSLGEELQELTKQEP